MNDRERDLVSPEDRAKATWLAQYQMQAAIGGKLERLMRGEDVEPEPSTVTIYCAACRKWVPPDQIIDLTYHDEKGMMAHFADICTWCRDNWLLFGSPITLTHPPATPRP